MSVDGPELKLTVGGINMGKLKYLTCGCLPRVSVVFFSLGFRDGPSLEQQQQQADLDPTIPALAFYTYSWTPLIIRWSLEQQRKSLISSHHLTAARVGLCFSSPAACIPACHLLYLWSLIAIRMHRLLVIGNRCTCFLWKQQVCWSANLTPERKLI